MIFGKYGNKHKSRIRSTALIFSVAFFWASHGFSKLELTEGMVAKVYHRIPGYSVEDIHDDVKGYLKPGSMVKLEKQWGGTNDWALLYKTARGKTHHIRCKTHDLLLALEKPLVTSQQRKQRVQDLRFNFRQDPATHRANARTGSVSIEQMNELMGKQLWTDDYLWDDEDRAVAHRLRWPFESRTSEQSGFRHYPDSDYRLAGARPFSAALYGRDGFTDSISLIYANKGDLYSEDREDYNLYKAMQQDKKILLDKLTQLLGEPRKMSYGVVKTMQEEVLRWDWKGHAILLAAPPGEYVSLRIIPGGVADVEGQGEKLRDMEIKEKLASKVAHNERGDITVSDIPMVNQGPKGYCAPATWERYLRYMGIPSDMYILAMAGYTGHGGGTYIHYLIESTRKLVQRYGRRLEDAGGLSMQNVKEYIDQGMPLMWCLDTSESYNAIADTYTQKRKDQQASWNPEKATQLRQELMPDFKRTRAGHICMIVGYNEACNEFAVSDSWGPEFELRWVPAELAYKVHLDCLLVITW